jgi:hypothetical protein
MDDDHLMFWEEHAQEAIEHLIREARYDDVRGTITLPPYNDDGHRWGVDCSNIEELQEHLIEVYNQEWYAYVPFEGGSAVFEDDAWGAVGDLMVDNPDINNFFARHAPPENAEALVTAQQLLQDAEASRVVRVSIEEINEELIRYLAANPSKMREMSPRKFEELVADMFRNQGFDVTLTPSSNDGGMDIVAVQRDGIGTVMVIVECKRYAENRRVGVEIARGLFGVVEQRRATRGIIATTSFFTRGAVDFRNTVPYRLGLADFTALTKEIEEWKNRIERQ